MIITHHKGAFIKITHGDTTIACGPISKKSSLPSTKFGADIALVPLNHPDFNGIDEVTRSGKEIFSIIGPGEYEIGGVFIKGVATHSDYSKDTDINTIYTIQLEDINIVYLGALSDKKIDTSFMENMDGVDILIVPIGGGTLLNASDAHSLAVSLESKIIIPILYDEGIASKDALALFLKEGGAEDTKSIEKLTVKRKDLEGKNGEIVVLM